MRRLACLSFTLGCLASWTHLAAEEPPIGERFACTGREPDWRLEMSGDTATWDSLIDLGLTAADATGRGTAMDHLRPPAFVWRGAGGGEPVVAVVAETICWDAQGDGPPYPLSALLSLPDGTVLTGCCAVPEESRLARTIWTLDRFRGRAVTGSPPPDIRFAPDGGISGFGGCNIYAGRLDQTTVAVVGAEEPLTGAATCGEEDAALERLYLEALAMVVSYRMEGRKLALLDTEGSVVLLYDLAE